MAVQRIDGSSEDEALIADRIMSNWADSQWHGDKFHYENAERVGVGITVDDETETVYAAISMC